MKRENTTGRKTIAIVGAGITGLSTAYYLKKAIHEEQLPYNLKLLEASDRPGGKIQTVKREGFTIERGPDSFLARKEPGIRLVENLGLKDELVRNQTGQAYILIQDALQKMPQGFSMGIPTSIESLMAAPIMSREGKERAAEELTVPASNFKGDQSLGQFLRRRFGNELVENVIEPLLSGIYSGDIDQMSLHATFPNFYELEQQYGSLIKGFEAMQSKRKSQPDKKQGQFYALKNGLDTIVQRLTEEIGRDVLSLHSRVERITYTDGTYTIHAGEPMEADIVVMATPHHVLPKVFPNYDLLQAFDDVPSTSVANVALAFDLSAVEQKLDGTGFAVSRNSDFRITACTWTHKKWEHTAPEGKALFRAYVGKPTDQEVVTLRDEEIVGIVLHDMKKTMNIHKEPEFSVVTRWKEAMPQYTVGHKERLEKVREQLRESLPGVFIAGSSYEGVGIPDCIGQAECVTEKVLMYLSEKR